MAMAHLVYFGGESV